MTVECTTTYALDLREAVTTPEGRHSIQALCVPYDQPTNLVDLDPRAYPNGEKFARGAFGELLAAPNAWPKVRLTDSHVETDKRRPVAKAVAFQDTDAGLVGTFQFFATPEGRGAFENVTEGTYGGVSIGFAVAAHGGERAENGTRVVTRARLHHVSLVDEPAYESAQVLAVRAATEAAQERDAALAARDAELRAYFARGFTPRIAPHLPQSFRDLMG
jgi:HK97 family phage prohead protease